MSFLGALIQNLIESLVGSGIEKAGDQSGSRVARGICLALGAAICAWIAVASALLWTSQRAPGVSGLWQYVQSGGPTWLLATPIVAALTLVTLVIPVAGRQSLAAALAAATIGLTLGSLAYFQGGGSNGVNVAAVASGVSSIPLPILGLILAVGDVPPLDSPWARISLIYWGRLKHLRTLRAWAGEHGWQVSGPAGKDAALTLQGSYDGDHPVTVTSGASFKLSTDASVAFRLSAKMGSPRDILALRISATPPPRNIRGRVVAIESRARLKPTIHFYIVPQPGQVIPDAVVGRMAPLVEAGRPYLGKLDFVRATPFGIRYTRMAARGLTRREAQLDPLLAWMRDLVALLEPISPGGQH